MKKLFILQVIFLAVTVIIAASCRNTSQPENTTSAEPVKQEPTKEQMVQRGEYIVTTGGCHDCHSPKQPGGFEPIQDQMLSGYPANRPIMKPDPAQVKAGWLLFNADLTQFVGPWGVSFGANLTSDQTGIGAWTEEQFFKAFREGKYKGLEGTRQLLPPMPWPNFAKMTDEDVKAIFAYLQSTTPINNAVPMPVPPQEMAAR